MDIKKITVGMPVEWFGPKEDLMHVTSVDKVSKTFSINYILSPGATDRYKDRPCSELVEIAGDNGSAKVIWNFDGN